MRHRGVITAGVLVTLLAAGTGAAVHADSDHAATGATVLADRETGEVITDTIPNDGRAYPVLELADLRLRAGQPVLLYGQYQATKVVTGPVDDESRVDNLQATWISCTTGIPEPGADYPDERSALSTRNHEGGDGVKRAISGQWLFTPPADGTYRCTLWGLGDAMIQQPARHMSVVSGQHTVLRMRGAPERGAQEWYQADDVHVSNEDKTAVVLEHRWTADPEAVSIDAFHGTQASSTSGGPDPFVIDTTLVVTQLDAAGAACAPPSTVNSVNAIPSVVHHLKINKMLPNIPVRTGDGCTRTFDFRVEVAYVRTLPVEHPNRAGMVHGAVPGSDPPRPYTTAIAMNNF